MDVHVSGIALVTAAAAITAGRLVACGRDGKGGAISGSAIHQAVADGAAANADIAVAGLQVTDSLIGVVELATGHAERTAAASIRSDGKLRIGQSTQGDRLLVTWHRPRYAVGIALDDAAADGDLIPVLIVPQQV